MTNNMIDNMILKELQDTNLKELEESFKELSTETNPDINKVNLIALQLIIKQRQEILEQRERIDELETINFDLNEENGNLERELEELKAEAEDDSE